MIPAYLLLLLPPDEVGLAGSGVVTSIVYGQTCGPRSFTGIGPRGYTKEGPRSFTREGPRGVECADEC